MTVLEQAHGEYRRAGDREALRHNLAVYEQGFSLKWRFRTQGEVCSVNSADIDADGYREITVGSKDRYVYVLNCHGQVQWKSRTQGEVWTTHPADINGDGYKEVIAGTSDGKVYVWDCRGRFQWTFKAKDIVYSVYSADLTGDGHREVIVGSKDGYIYVLDCHGNELWKYDTGASIWRVSAADVYGDGRYQIISGPWTGAADSFVQIIDYMEQRVLWKKPVIDGSWSVCAADINEDEKKEVIGSSYERAVCAYDVQGQLLWEYPANSEMWNLVLADVDNDGEQEIIAGSWDGHVHILDSRGCLYWKYRSADSIWDVHAADLDRDGHTELVVGSFDHNVYVYRLGLVRGLHDDILQSYQHLSESGQTSSELLGLEPRHFELLQMIVGLQSTAATRKFPEAVALYERGEYYEALRLLLELFDKGVDLKWQYKGCDYAIYVQAADVDNDGSNKIISGSRAKDGCAYLYVLDDRGNLKWSYPSSSSVWAVWAGDVNGDGCKEIVAGTDDGKVYLFDHLGRLVWEYQTGGSVWSVYISDVNADGRNEIIVGSFDKHVYIFDGHTPIQLIAKWPVDDKVYSLCPLRDGLVVGLENNQICGLDSEGGVRWRYKTDNFIFYLQACDIDEDGHQEIVAGCWGNYVYTLDWQGNLKWKARIPRPPYSIWLADIDNRGDTEVVVGPWDTFVYAFDPAGNPKGRYEVGNWIRSVHVTAFEDGEAYPRHLIVGCTDGEIRYFGLPDKKVVTNYVTQCYRQLQKTEDELDILEQFLPSGTSVQLLAELSGRDGRAQDTFRRLAGKEDAGTRTKCVLALEHLCKFEPEICIDLLGRFVTDEHEEVRLAAVEQARWAIELDSHLTFTYLRRLAQDSQSQVQVGVIRLLGDLANQYPNRSFDILLGSLSNRDEWTRHELARSLARYFDVHPDQLLIGAKALFTHQCGLDIIDCVSILARNEVVRKVFLVYRTLLDDTDSSNVGVRLEAAVTDLAALCGLVKYGEEIYNLYQALHKLYNLQSVGDIVRAWPVGEGLPKREGALYPNAIETLASLSEVVNLLAKYQEREAVGDRLASLLDVVNGIEGLQGEVAQRFLVSKGSKYAYPEQILFSLLLSRWRELVRADLARLRGRAELEPEFRTKRTPYGEQVTLVLQVHNIGKSPAENVRVQLMDEEEYVIIGEDSYHIEFLSSQKTVTLEFTIQPAKMVHRVSFQLIYDDAEGQGKTIAFADRVEFFEESREFSPIANPYVAGRPITSPQMFFGRRDVLDLLKLRLGGPVQTNNVIVLHGQRRSGKSSILYQLLNTSLLAPHIPVYMDMQGLMGVDTAGFFSRLERAINQALAREGVRGRTPIILFFYGLAKKISQTLAQKGAGGRDPTLPFNDFLDEVEEELGERNLILMFDEFEWLEKKVKAGEISQDVFGYFRSLVQHRRLLNFIFTGTHTLQLLSRDYWSIFFNIALHRKISFLDEQAATALITEPVAGQLEYDPLAVEKILKLAAGHPYFIQLICDSLVNHCNQTKRNYATITDVNTVLKEVMDTGQNHFEFAWINSSSQERLVLAAIAHIGREEGRSVSLADLERVHRELSLAFDEKAMKEAVRNLVERDILAETAGWTRFRIVVGLIRHWLQGAKPLEQVVRDEFKTPRSG